MSAIAIRRLGDVRMTDAAEVGGKAASLGERLVSGEAVGDEWVVPDGAPRPRRRAEGAIDRGQARMVASAAREIADARGTPQDIEWAIDSDGALWVLQARPMTALPPDVSW